MGRKAISKDENRSSTPEGAQHSPGSFSAASPEMALEVWLSWMKDRMGALAGLDPAASPMSQWLMAPNAATGNASFTNVDQLTKMLNNDLILSSVDRMWNANPFHDIIPVDWTRGRARAAHSMVAVDSRPGADSSSDR